MTTETIAIAVRPEQRDWILNYAACMLPPGEREPDAVIAKAAPLLDWAAEAPDRDDLRARMSAMSNAHCNDQARLRVSGVAERLRLTPQDFLAKALAYYVFITGREA